MTCQLVFDLRNVLGEGGDFLAQFCCLVIDFLKPDSGLNV